MKTENMTPIGRLANSAGNKAITAELSVDEVEALLEKLRLERQTSTSRTDMLEKQIASIEHQLRAQEQGAI